MQRRTESTCIPMPSQATSAIIILGQMNLFSVAILTRRFYRKTIDFKFRLRIEPTDIYCLVNQEQLRASLQRDWEPEALTQMRSSSCA